MVNLFGFLNAQFYYYYNYTSHKGVYRGLAQNRPSTSAKWLPNWITIKQLANHNKLDSKAHHIVTSGAGVQACREGCGKGALAPHPTPPPP